MQKGRVRMAITTNGKLSLRLFSDKNMLALDQAELMDRWINRANPG
jgi:hypothetical protein